MPVFLVDKVIDDLYEGYEVASKWNTEVSRGLYLDKVIVNPEEGFRSVDHRWRVMVEATGELNALDRGKYLIACYINLQSKEKWAIVKISARVKQITIPDFNYKASINSDIIIIFDSQQEALDFINESGRSYPGCLLAVVKVDS